MYWRVHVVNCVASVMLGAEQHGLTVNCLMHRRCKCLSCFLDGVQHLLSFALCEQENAVCKFTTHEEKDPLPTISPGILRYCCQKLNL